MSPSSNPLARVFAFSAAGVTLLYGGISAFSPNDSGPGLVAEGAAVALGIILIALAVRSFRKSRHSDDVTEVIGFVKSESTYAEPPMLKPLRSTSSRPLEEQTVQIPFVERRKGGDRRANDRRQTIVWGTDDRQGPGRRRNNGRRASDRLFSTYSF